MPPWLGYNSKFAQWALGIASTCVLFYLFIKGSGSLVLALMLASILLVVLAFDKVTAMLLSFAYLILLGDLRRIRDLLFPRPQLDPLLLVVVLLTLFLALPLLLRVRLRDGLSKAMFFLLILMFLQMFNPSQGSLSLGLAGGLFYIVPVLWFWVGRAYGGPAVVERLIYHVLIPFAFLNAVFGLCQTFFGFPAYQQAWIDSVKLVYNALDIGGVIRPFGFSVSAAEYATILAMGAAAAAGAFFGRKRVWSLAFPVLAVALFLASGRGIVVKLTFALILLWVLRKGQQMKPIALLRLIILIGLCFGTISEVSSRFANTGAPARSAAAIAIAHQTSGLANPLDSSKSTAGLHLAIISGGLLEGFTYPIGHGLGYTTIAGGKLGGGTGNTENDFSDMFISLGVAGGFLYLYIIFAVLRESVRYVRRVPKTVGFPVMVVIMSGISAWLIGGQYSTAVIFMFLIGALANQNASEPVKVKKQLDRPLPLRASVA